MKGLKLLAIYPGHCLQSLSKGFSTSSVSLQRHYKLLIVGAGAGGCAVANKFTSKLGPEEVGVIEPNEVCIFHFSFHLNIKLNKLRKKKLFCNIVYKMYRFVLLCVYIYMSMQVPGGKLQQTCGKIVVALLIMGYP